MPGKWSEPYLKWTAEKKQWLMEHATTDRKKDYGAFCARFGNDINFQGFSTERSRLGISKCEWAYRGRKDPRPEGSTRLKKGYVYVKVGGKFIPKGRKVYMDSHPDYTFEKGDQFIFLDGDNRNFNKENIDVIKKRESFVFQSFGGTVKGHPELTRLNIIRSRLRLAELDCGEKLGMTYQTTSGRRFYGRKRKQD